MQHDFAQQKRDKQRPKRNRSTQRHTHAHQKNAPPAWRKRFNLLIFIVFVIIALTSVLASLKWHDTQSAKTRSSRDNTPLPAQGIHPEFDFYTVLPEMDPVLEETPVEKATPTPQAAHITEAKKPLPPPPIKPKQFMLQVASFKHLEDADALRADLILKGYDATIASFTKDAQTWQRVLIGPYDTVASAKAVQSQLKQAHHAAIIVNAK